MAESSEKLSLPKQRFDRRGFLAGAFVFAGGMYWWLRRGTSSELMAAGSAPEPAVPGKPALVTIVEFTDAGQRKGTVRLERIVKTEEEWKKQLTPDQFYVARKGGTERPFVNAYADNHERGVYRCVCCGTALYSSQTKYESGTGWPSFWAPIAKENIETRSEYSLGIGRVEVLCRLCEAHLGHVFDDGPKPTGLRYCMNSAAMRFVAAPLATP
jgi:peptide-methionine (R)-S-oxide reductase